MAFQLQSAGNAMNSISFPGLHGRASAPDDELQWQRACNEGWPERYAAITAAPLGYLAPAAAMERPSNVVRLDVWQARRRTRAAAAQ